MNERKDIQVATMTFHVAHNYGAMLQAYALPIAVRKLGFSCEVLDYRFPYIDQWTGKWSCKDLQQESGIIKGMARWIYRSLFGYYREQTQAQKKFNHFMHHKMILSHRAYFNVESLRTVDYDAILFGSDQIWNPELTGGVASEFLGDFVDYKKTRLISYAVSCGRSYIPEEYEPQMLPFIDRFHSLGIREDGFTQWLNTKYGYSAETVMDPVFLLDKKDWDVLLEGMRDIIKEPYLLIYAFDVSESVYDLARCIANKYGYKLVSVCYNPQDNHKDMLQLADCGPMEFLWLLRNASFVCTSSFHGEALSIVFRKDFYCIAHPVYGQRNRDLLKLLGMDDRLIEEEWCGMDIKPCDYSLSEKLLAKEIDKSMNFLRKSIERKHEEFQSD